MPAPPGNSNALSRGFRGSKLPPGCSHVAADVAAFRAEMTAELQAEHGDNVPLLFLAFLQSAARHETMAALASKWLRRLPADAPQADRLALMDRIERATDARDKALKSMGLAPRDDAKDKRKRFGDLLDAAYPPPPPAEPQAPQDPPA